MALLVSSGPLSEMQLAGLPWRAISASSSRATLAPDSDVSGINARLSRVKSSTTARMRKRRPSVKQSETKSSDQRSAARQLQRRPNTERTLAPNTPAHMQLFLAVEPAETLMVHVVSFSCQHHM